MGIHRDHSMIMAPKTAVLLTCFLLCCPHIQGECVDWTPRPDQQVWTSTDVTVVTALFDIGRGQWISGYRRSYDHYIHYMTQTMQLKVNVVVFGDTEAIAAAHHFRCRHSDKTHLVEMRFHDLPLFRHRGRMQDIMESARFRQDNALAAYRHPEANIPEYDILMLSKGFFLDRAMQANPFNSSYFIWLDAGYGHGEAVFPEDGIWNPTNLLEHGDKVTMIELGKGVVGALKDDLHRLHKRRIAPINGGFLGGGRQALQRMHVLQQEVIADWLTAGIIDDDQSCLVFAYFKEPTLFRLVNGGWYDVFKLFNSPM